MKCTSCHSELPEGAACCPTCGAGVPRAAHPTDCEYAAFISYRHLPRDREIARKVQAALESFKMPRGIALPRNGKAGRRLGKCFRDEDELAATHSLPDRILEALGSSSALVVICSPSTQESAWVQREIEAFIAMHGRERVFAVLAEGSAAESIPDQLRVKQAEGGGSSASAGGNDNSRGGSVKSESANPLAADLRPGSAKRHRDEMLRLVAAIAGCGYDDLKRRDRTRKRKRAAIALACALAIIATVASAAIVASQAQRSAQVAESQRLAIESSQRLSQGDRYGAIELALEALPKSESANDRPFVPEARGALENALEIEPPQNSPWLASYEIRTDVPLGVIGSSLSHKTGSELERCSVIEVNDQGGYFALSDGAGKVSTYDVVTGRKLADCIMPDEAAPLDGTLFARTMGATENYVLVANGGNTSVLATFDAKTGDMVDFAQGAGCPSFDTSYGDDLVSMSFPRREGGFSVIISDVAAATASSVDVTDVGPVKADVGTYFNTPGGKLGDNYSVFGNRLFHVRLDDGAVESAELAYPEATSLEYVDGLAIVASAEPMSGDDVTRRFAIEAFDGNLDLKWRHEGSFASEMIVNDGISSLVAGAPEICGPISGGKQIVASVGRRVITLDSTTGEPAETTSFDQSVVAVGLTWYSENEPGLIVAACSNGTVNCKDLLPGSLDPEGDGRRLSLPFPIRWARFAECDGYLVLLAVPADSDNRIVSFRTDWMQGEQSGKSRSTDELIELAHAVLRDGGRE